MTQRKTSHPALVPALCLALCLLSVPLACSFGALHFKALDVALVLAGKFTDADRLTSVRALLPTGQITDMDAGLFRSIILDLRLPRVMLALLSGMALALAGTVFQAVLRNPLADPFTLGVSGGAAFGAALAISLGFTGLFWGLGLPLAAFAGAGAALAAVLLLGRLGGGLRHETLILAGVVVSAFLAALIALVKALDEASVTGIVFWIMGSFQGRGERDLLLCLPGCLLGGAVIFALARELDMLSLGDRAARHLGLDAGKARLLLLLAAGLATASCVSVSGIIGFVGLIVPHLMRMLLGAAHRLLLPAAALAGGLLLLWSDTAARCLLPGGVELPVGVITALLGGPFFCYILGKGRGVAKRRGSPFERTPPRLEGSEGKTPQIEATQAEALRSESAQAEAARIEAARSEARGQAAARNGASRNKAAQSAPVSAPAPQGDILCQDLGFRYPRREEAALSGISLNLAAGDFVGLLGPNGSGKSTLLHLISGLLTPSAGKLSVAGRDMAALPEKQRALLLAALPQRPESIPALSAFSLVLMGRYARTPFLGAYSARDKEAAMAALEECGAGHLAARSADCLSGGELQRVLLARCLAQDAAVLLLDEAVAGLDPACARQVLGAIARRNQRQGLTVVAVMHELNLAALYCRSLIFLRQGRLAALGPTDQVFKPEILEKVYDTPMTVLRHPLNGLPQVLP